ncbi:hypothetical protein D3C75_679250 [compost metagenome]
MLCKKPLIQTILIFGIMDICNFTQAHIMDRRTLVRNQIIVIKMLDVQRLETVLDYSVKN